MGGYEVSRDNLLQDGVDSGAVKRPSFFIVGAPRCGTTALRNYLSRHPRVFMPTLKEPLYFGRELWHRNAVRSMDEYMGLFRGAKAHHLAVGEKSVWYMCSRTAVKEIREFDEHAKLIAMLRNPLDLLRSLHSWLLYMRHEDEPDFETAWRLQRVRKEGRRIPSMCHHAAMLQYAQVGRLGEQVERLLAVFPREQVKFIVFDDFAGDTRSIYEDVLSFLGVSSDGRTRFPRHGATRGHRWDRFAGLLLVPPPVVRDMIKAVKRILRVRHTGIGQLLLNLSAKKAEPRSLSDSFRRELTEEFRDDIERLSQILGRDLGHWAT